ncbi:uncharacterized protein PAC_05043 [Phialocephala subalpina]|uniref:2EXR domain-containing protein n=1 Tax=Phialocephala subalpina TaxID=576137 RepID=A0A1L7WQV7_9HELO|nr:uncharacterized protein PAC_05043 [Phialocephala subalpina]
MADLTRPKLWDKLPYEVQDMIWDLTLQETHQVFQHTLSGKNGYSRWRHATVSRSLSPILHVCARSRARAKAHFTEYGLEHKQVWSCGSSGVSKHGKCIKEEKLPQRPPWNITPAADQVVRQLWNPEYDYIFVKTKKDTKNCPPESVCDTGSARWCIREFDWKIKYLAMSARDWNETRGWYNWLIHSYGLEYIFVIADRQRWELRDELRDGYFGHGPFYDLTELSEVEWEKQKHDLYTSSRERLKRFGTFWRKYGDPAMPWHHRPSDIYDKSMPAGRDDLLRIGALKLQIVESEEEIKKFIAALPKSKKISDSLKM